MVSARHSGARRGLRRLVARSDPVLGICLLRTAVVPLHRLQHFLSRTESGGNAHRDYDSLSADSNDCRASTASAR